MTHPLFRKEIFVETAFERRFQAMLRSALHRRSWHVIVADPGSGKTMGIRDLVRTTGSPSILAVTAPKNNESEQAIGNQLFAALGLSLRGRWSERKPKLMGSMVQFGVKCLIVDDAHDLSLEHLMFIKELTDQGRLHYDYPLGLCLVAAGRGNTIPLKEIFDQPDTMWLQFRRRLDKLEPFCRIAEDTQANMDKYQAIGCIACPQQDSKDQGQYNTDTQYHLCYTNGQRYFLLLPEGERSLWYMMLIVHPARSLILSLAHQNTKLVDLHLVAFF